MAAEFRISKRKVKKVAAIGGAVGAAVFGRRLVRTLPGTRNILAKLKKFSRKSAIGRIPGKIRGKITRSGGEFSRAVRAGRRAGRIFVASRTIRGLQSVTARNIRALRG